MKDKFEAILGHFQKELAGLQVGRVSPAILDDVMVEAYGTHTPIPQVASVTAQGAQMLLIQPWDSSITKEVERALRICGRDYNPSVDGAVVRLPFPPITEDKRKSIVKLVAERAEEAKVQIKLVREDLMKAVKAAKADKTMSEDQAAAEQKEIQKLVDHYHKSITDLADSKSADIMKI
jgi:ribosome recycling factor